MLLLSDGTVMAQGAPLGSVGSSQWFRLTPDASGSYANGTWTTLASMHVSRQYFPSNVLPDGRVFLVGGEYSSGGGFTNTAEMYDPLTDTWTNLRNFPLSQFGDDPTALLPDGRILAGYYNGAQTYIYNPASDTWTFATTKLHGDISDEETWVKLPDDSILSYDVWGSPAVHSQRYIPSQNRWVDADDLPVVLSGPDGGDELGPAFRLPDGRVWFTGATGHTAYYDLSSNSWAAGPDLPAIGGRQLSAYDNPGAVLPNGRVIIAVGRLPVYGTPTSILEFDPTTDTYTDVSPPVTVLGLTGAAYNFRMLVLPTGQILVANGTSGRLALYTPDGAPDASWRPAIASVADNGDGTFTLTGTQLNGLSEGAAYGDDAEMSSNYPIVQVTDSAGQVLYARTYNWSSTGVATGDTLETTQFTLPAGVIGSYSLTVIANGIASDPFVAQTPQLSGVVFNDLDGSGTADGSNPGLAGWTVFIDLHGDGVPHDDDPVAVTDGSGNYSFSNLGPGTYTIAEVLPDGWAQTAPAGDVYTVTLVDGTTSVTGLDFGNTLVTPGVLSGTVFNDLGGSGGRDPGDPGLAGWTVFIDLYGDGVLHNDDPQAVTDALGRFSFSNLAPGNYTVYEVPQDGWIQSAPAAGFYGATILDGTTIVTGLDFGNFQEGPPPPAPGGGHGPGGSPFRGGDLAALLAAWRPGTAPTPGGAAPAAGSPRATAAPGGVDWTTLVHRAAAAAQQHDPWTFAGQGRHSPWWDDLFVGIPD
jgi:hypothetical protein